MKFSEQWLRDWVNPPLTTDELVEQLTMAGLEVDGFEAVAAEFDGVVVAEVLEVNPHPDADKLKVCSVAMGEGKPLQIVCGAPNVCAGMKVPLAKVGGKLGDTKIKKAKLRGVESHGMLCSEEELGISDSHEGLMALPEDAPLGQDIRDYLQLDDVIIDLDLTPNRSDCLGIAGLARETGVLNNIDVSSRMLETLSVTVPSSIDDTFPVRLEAKDECPRYVGRVIRDINLNAETPQWMKEKLRRSDLRSIDPLVDVTNYVMMELGQPLHAFDLEKLQGEIVVRLSRADEKIQLLDGSEVNLDDSSLLITDQSGPVAIAGVMGGLGSSVTDTTQHLFLESAYFSPLAIAGKARAYGMNTDASHRFERGVDWQLQVKAIERATELLLQIVGGKAGPVTETVAEDHLPTVNQVKLRSDRITRLLGVEIDNTAIDTMLSRLGFEFRRIEDTAWLVNAPSHRFDIAIEADLIEEISRVFGYNNLPVRAPRAYLTMEPIPEERLTTMAFRHQLVARGYQEAITYSFVDEKFQKVLDPLNEPLGLENPISADQSVMRTTLWPGLIKSLIYNVNRQQEGVLLFETGLRFIKAPNQDQLDLSNITQEKMLAGVACGRYHAENWCNENRQIDFFDVKGDLETLLSLTGNAQAFAFAPASHPALHPAQTAEITREGNLVGHMGLIHPQVQKSLGLSMPVYLFELKLEGLITRELPEFHEISKYPEVRRDIAVIIDESVAFSDIRQTITESAVKHLSNLKLFDLFRGKGIDPNRKSVALGLTFQHTSRTLTDEEISKSENYLVDLLKNRFGASLRN